MKRRVPTRRPAALVGLFLLTGALAVVGGLMLVVRPDGSWLRLSPDLLTPTPFGSYRVPGLVLALIVGGSQLAGGVAVRQRRPGHLRLATVAALVLGGWIALQAVVLGTIVWQQPVFLLVSIVELGMIASVLPRTAAQGRRRRAR